MCILIVTIVVVVVLFLIMQEKLYRPNVGIVILNKDNKVLVCDRADVKSGAWQMPQGGIDDGEDIIIAAKRELLEETGIKGNDIKLLKVIDDWFFYDFPDSAFRDNDYIRADKYKGQRQKWVVFRFIGDKDKIDITKAEHKEFYRHKWMTFDEILSKVVSFRLPIYKKVFATISNKVNLV